MVEMNPYYARESKVGPVFDVATWNARFAFAAIFFAIAMFVVCGSAAYVVASPASLAKAKSQTVKDFHKALVDFKKDHPTWAGAIVVVAGVLAWFGFAGTFAMASDFLQPNFYLRIGPGGISLRLPHGLDVKKLCFATEKLELDLPWNEIADWKVMQTRRLGSLSPNAGNVSADMTINLHNGKRHWIDLNIFKENGRIIWQRISEAAEMAPMQFDAPASSAQTEQMGAGTIASHAALALDAARNRNLIGFVEQQIALEAALSTRLYASRGTVVACDAASDKFVQFVVGNGSITLDFPVQSLSALERQLAGDFFAARGKDVVESELLDRPGGTAVGVQKSYTAELGDDVELAAMTALAIFRDVYGLPDDFHLNLEAY